MTLSTRQPKSIEDADRLVICDWCGQETRIVYFYGSGLCAQCHRVLIECCQGEA